MTMGRANKEKTEIVEEIKEAVVEEVKQESVKNNIYGVVVTEGKILNVRSKPTPSAEIIDKLEPTTKVEILDKKLDAKSPYYKIKTSNGIVGFCLKEYIGISK